MDFLYFLEELRIPFFDYFFLLVTKLGEETLFMALAITIFWCFSKKEGYYILSVGFVGTVINQFLKLSFKIPRPWVRDTNFKAVEGAIEEASGYSFPSGHTQISVGTYGSVAYSFKNKLVRIICIAICILVPFSRMYLGVHTPSDVLVSILVSVLLILLIRPIIDRAYENDKYMYIFIASISLLAVAYLLYVHLMPTDNIDEANYISGLKNAYTLVGALGGMLISYPIEKKYVKFETSGKWYTQVLKVALGLIIMLGLLNLLKYPLNAIFPEYTIARAIRYFLVVVFAVVIYPLSFPIFKRLEK